MVLSYFAKSATPAQQKRWLSKIVSEGSVIAIAMSEPELGSDLATLKTTAVKSADGKSWVLNGRKMWISAGATADIVVISAVTDARKGAKGISLFAVEKGTAGFDSAKRFKKVGKDASDTCLLTLENVTIPADNIIGVEGEGFVYMMSNRKQKHTHNVGCAGRALVPAVLAQHAFAVSKLTVAPHYVEARALCSAQPSCVPLFAVVLIFCSVSKERLSIAIGSAAAARRALALTLNYIHGREMFGGVTAHLQSVQQKLAQLRLEIQLVSSFVDQCILAQSTNTLSAETASMAKVAATELASRVADTCLQMYGGYGYLKNNPVAKIWVDQRVTRICKHACEQHNARV